MNQLTKSWSRGKTGTKELKADLIDKPTLNSDVNKDVRK